MITLFYILAGLYLALGILSLIQGIQFHRFVLRALSKAPEPYLPGVCLLVPCKGLDQNFSDHIRALMHQVYPTFTIIFVTSDAEDPAYRELQRLVRNSPVQTRLITTGEARNRGQKVHNLMEAVRQVEPETEVLAFADSDALPARTWLRDLVAPLANEKIGMTTGYRWYVPQTCGFWSAAQSVWNAGVLTLLGDHARNFAWGGSVAIRKKMFDQANVLAYWENALSDDYAMTRAIINAGYSIQFVPQCLVITQERCTFKQLLEWVRRQVTITKIYDRKLWIQGAVSQLGYTLVLCWGVVLALPRLSGTPHSLFPLILMAGLIVLGALKGALRLQSVKRILEGHRDQIERSWWGHTFLTPFISFLNSYAFLFSMSTNRITWRGVTYEMRSANETLMIRSQEAHGVVKPRRKYNQ